MRTTIDIEDSILDLARNEAVRAHKPLREIVEDALREKLLKKDRSSAINPVTLPVSRKTGGVLPEVDLDDSAALLDAMG